MNTSERKADQLGMKFGTACAQLRKILLFSFVQETNRDICVRCNEKIRSIEELSIEHIEPWLDNDVKLFWDLANIGFSHLACNRPHRHKGPSGNHGQQATYKRGCRCEICKAWKQIDNKKYRGSKAKLATL